VCNKANEKCADKACEKHNLLQAKKVESAKTDNPLNIRGKNPCLYNKALSGFNILSLVKNRYKELFAAKSGHLPRERGRILRRNHKSFNFASQ
jgi:hypothetical protein